MPVILATWESETSRIMALGKHGQISKNDQSKMDQRHGSRDITQSPEFKSQPTQNNKIQKKKPQRAALPFSLCKDTDERQLSVNQKWAIIKH
jgi:hypothetical protein